MSKCVRHWWMTVVPKDGKCYKKCSKCGTLKKWWMS